MNDVSPDGLAIDALGLIGAQRIVPVLTIEEVENAVPLVLALAAGGLSVVEITLRTPDALDAIRRVASEVGPVVGAGSVTSATAAERAIDAGAKFIVSPGLDEGVIETAQARWIPVIPGIATPTELLRAQAMGINLVKLFPAEVVGGPAMIRALSAVWPNVRFMPTGGVSAANVAHYLALPQVLAVGGFWMVSADAVDRRDWQSITETAASTAAMVGGAG